jgi:hypothetical protein
VLGVFGCGYNIITTKIQFKFFQIIVW